MGSHIPVALTGDIDDGMEDFETCIRPLVETLDSLNTPMTIPITASSLAIHARKLGYIGEHGNELAGHGDIHSGFVGPIEDQVRRLDMMMKQFEDCLGIRPTGFRAPFLTYDENLFPALVKHGLRYDSSSVSKDLKLYLRYSMSRRPMVYARTWATTLRVIKGQVQAANHPRPFKIAGELWELPVFEIDDWFLFEAEHGPHISDSEMLRAADLWRSALRHADRPGNLFVIQAHPKRMSPRRLGVLERFVDYAKARGHKFLRLSEARSRMEDA